MQVKTYPDNAHYQSKRGKSVTLAKDGGARDAVDARKSLGKERRPGRVGEAGNKRATSVFVAKRVVSEETG